MTAITSNLPIAVPTPAWLRRRMLRNLRAAAHNRISPDRATKAREIFAAIERNGETPRTKPVEGTAALGISTTNVQAPQQSSRNRPTGDGKHHSPRHETWPIRLGSAAKTLINRVSRW